MSLTRRTALQILGAAALPSFAGAALPSITHARAVAYVPTLFRSDERATISAIVDALLPRTDTLGALDAGVPAFIEFLSAEWMNDDERTLFREGMTEIEERVRQEYGKPWPALDASTQTAEFAWAEGAKGALTKGQRTLRRIKAYALHGYVTSERVQREVFKTNITPGRYLGCLTIPSAGEDE